LKFEYPYLPKTFEKTFIKRKRKIFLFIFLIFTLKIIYECLWILKFNYPYLPKTFEKNFIKENIFILFMDIHFAKNLLTKKFKKMNFIKKK
jgi:hypothetical protein